MFSYREFLKKGFLDAVGRMADYQIRLNAGGYYEKGVLLEEDLMEIDAAIEAQYATPDTPETVPEDGAGEVIEGEETGV